MKPAIIAAALAALAGSAQAQQPTAIEAFILQGECQKLGQQFLNKALNGAVPNWEVEMEANYKPAENRCYVSLRAQINVTGFQKGMTCFENGLYDGQTQRILAFTISGKACKWDEKDAYQNLKRGIILGNPSSDFDETEDFIRSKIKRD
jgi:hypothetical protein